MVNGDPSSWRATARVAGRPGNLGGPVPQGVARPPERAAVTHCAARRCCAVADRRRGTRLPRVWRKTTRRPCSLPDAERRTQALGATRMVVEWLVNDPL